MSDKTITAARVQQEYERGKDYKNGLNLYESVKTCERMVEGDQWAGVVTKKIRPITMNFLDPICYYKVAQIVSDDVGQEIEPFLPDEAAKQAAQVLDQSIDRIVERQKIKSRHREILRDAFVDGDAALYFWWDNDAKTGMAGVQGDIAAESIMNTNVIFGNPQSNRVQRQPYILIAQRVPVRQEREKAKRLGIAEWESIVADTESEYKGEDELTETDVLCTKLTRFWKDKDGYVCFLQVIGTVVVKEETQTGMTMYPLAYMNWKPRKNSMHGVREIEPLINTQIAVNKQYTALGAQVMNNGEINAETAAKALDRLEVDELGLDMVDRRMLQAMIKHYGGGPVGLDTLAAVIGEEAVTIEDVYEPYLMQIGFISRTPRGRVVLPAAYQHLGIPYAGGAPGAGAVQMTFSD